MVDDLADGGEHGRGQFGQPGSKPDCLLNSRAVFDDPLDQSDSLGLCGVDCSGSEQQLPGACPVSPAAEACS